MLQLKPHIGNLQPTETENKTVVYQCDDGHICLPYPADLLNWVTKNQPEQKLSAATFGAVTAYAVMG